MRSQASLERKRRYMREYNLRNREKRSARAKKDWANRDLAHQRALRRKRRYGLLPGDFERIAKTQGYVCALCQTKPPVDVDHDHETKAIRGLLCRSCNIGLGLLGDTIERLVDAIAYLKRPAGTGG